jgi:hypothetical protein
LSILFSKRSIRIKKYVNLAKENSSFASYKFSRIQPHGTNLIAGHDCETQDLISKSSYPHEARFSHGVPKP